MERPNTPKRHETNRNRYKFDKNSTRVNPRSIETTAPTSAHRFLTAIGIKYLGGRDTIDNRRRGPSIKHDGVDI